MPRSMAARVLLGIAMLVGLGLRAKADWGELSAAWAEDDFEELQQQAIEARLA